MKAGFYFSEVTGTIIEINNVYDWANSKAKKSKNTILYAIVGFLLIKIPYTLIRAFYGRPGCEKTSG